MEEPHLHSAVSFRCLLCFVVLSVLVFALPAYAQTTYNEIIVQQGAVQDVSGLGVLTPAAIVTRIVNASLMLIGAAFVGLLVYAGFLWMTAAGESDKVEKAQTTIRSAIIGLVVVLLAYAIANFVIVRLVEAT